MTSIVQQLKQAQSWCQSQGRQLTPQRQDILSVLFKARRAIKAYDILSELQKKQPNMAPVTVYRALDFLVELGLVHKLESQQAFVACDHFLDAHEPCIHHGIMLICNTCQQVQEIDSATIFDQLNTLAIGLGFLPVAQDVELRGRCASCQ